MEEDYVDTIIDNKAYKLIIKVLNKTDFELRLQREEENEYYADKKILNKMNLSIFTFTNDNPAETFCTIIKERLSENQFNVIKKGEKILMIIPISEERSSLEITIKIEFEKIDSYLTNLLIQNKKLKAKLNKIVDDLKNEFGISEEKYNEFMSNSKK